MYIGTPFALIFFYYIFYLSARQTKIKSVIHKLSNFMYQLREIIIALSAEPLPVYYYLNLIGF